MYSGSAATEPNADLDPVLFKRLLEEVDVTMGALKNRVESSINRFVISTGSYVMPLHAAAIATVRRIGLVQVDGGGTDCKISLATEYIAKVGALGKLGQRKDNPLPS